MLFPKRLLQSNGGPGRNVMSGYAYKIQLCQFLGLNCEKEVN